MTQRTHPSGNQKGRPGRRTSPPTLWALRDPEMLGLVFQAFEALTTLRPYCARQVAEAREEDRLFGHLWLTPDHWGLQRWSGMSERITTSWQVLDRTVRTNQLDLAQCQECYRHMLGIRTTWAGLDRQASSLKLLDKTTDCLRQVLIRYAQAQGQLRRPQP